MKFITKSTKLYSLIVSIITIIALITFIMISSLLEMSTTNLINFTFIYTTTLALFIFIWYGILNIKVFNDYKSKRIYLCSDGIITLCTGILISIALLLSFIVKTNDINIFITSFLCIFTLWKVVVLVLSIKEKHFNWWINLLYSVFSLILTILSFISIFNYNNVILWMIVGTCWLSIVLSIFYILFTYIIKIPNYLETEEALEERKLELEQIKLRRNKINTSSSSFSSSSKEKLRKLKELKDDNLISEEDYLDKKSELLEKF